MSGAAKFQFLCPIGNTVKSRGRIMKQGGFFFCGPSCGNPLESIPQGRIANSSLINWKIAFEHTAMRAKRLNNNFNHRAPKFRELFRAWWLWFFMCPKTKKPHTKAPDFHENIGTMRQFT